MPSLTTLPEEILIRIFDELSWISLANVVHLHAGFNDAAWNSASARSLRDYREVLPPPPTIAVDEPIVSEKRALESEHEREDEGAKRQRLLWNLEFPEVPQTVQTFAPPMLQMYPQPALHTYVPPIRGTQIGGPQYFDSRMHMTQTQHHQTQVPQMQFLHTRDPQMQIPHTQFPQLQFPPHQQWNHIAFQPRSFPQPQVPQLNFEYEGLGPGFVKPRSLWQAPAAWSDEQIMDGQGRAGMSQR